MLGQSLKNDEINNKLIVKIKWNHKKKENVQRTDTTNFKISKIVF